MGPTFDAFADPLALLVAALAVYRLTRLVVADELTAPLRDRVVGRGGRLAYLVTCPWCISVWIAAGWVLLLVLLPLVALVAGTVLALSAVAGLLSSLE